MTEGKKGSEMSDVKRIDIKEFRELGFLQEANRLFFHPLGLALEVVIDDETGEERLGGVWDYRDDPEGMFYAGDYLPEQEKVDRVAAQQEAKIPGREAVLGEGRFIQTPEDKL